MPYLTAADGVALFFWTINYIKTSLQSGKCGSDCIQEANQLFSEFLRQPETTTTIASQIDARVNALMHTESFQRAVKVMFFVTPPLLWTAFETVARDAWASAINSAPISTAHRVFKSLEDDEGGIGKKSIEIGTLAKYGFDLRGRLGGILQEKFHFSSIEGIAKAYRSAFPDNKTFLSIFENRDLKSVEQTRHLITHNAGIIDEIYKKRSGSDQNVGDELLLTGSQLSLFGSAIVEAGIGILLFVDTFLASTAGSKT